MIRLLFLSLGTIIMLAACNNKRSSSSVSDDHTMITGKINTLYIRYGKSNEALYHRTFSDSLFSPDLKKTLETAVNTSKADIERVKKSNHPDEKPLIFEGAVFSGLYEGYTGYKIKSVHINTGKTAAEAAVEFEYALSPPRIVWTDHIRLISSKQGWKIDNIVFDTIAHSKDLKTTLNEFIKSNR